MSCTREPWRRRCQTDLAESRTDPTPPHLHPQHTYTTSTTTTTAIPAPPLSASQTLVDAANSNGNSNVLMVPAGVLPSDVLAGRCDWAFARFGVAGAEWA